METSSSGSSQKNTRIDAMSIMDGFNETEMAWKEIHAIVLSSEDAPNQNSSLMISCSLPGFTLSSSTQLSMSWRRLSGSVSPAKSQNFS